MTITEREVRGVVILDLQDRFVLEDGVPSFVERMNALIRHGRKSILLNFDRVTYLDSAGVGAIAWKYVTARKQDCDVKLLTVIANFQSEPDAIESFFVDNEDDDLNPIFT